MTRSHWQTYVKLTQREESRTPASGLDPRSSQVGRARPGLSHVLLSPDDILRSELHHTDVVFKPDELHHPEDSQYRVKTQYFLLSKHVKIKTVLLERPPSHP